MNYVALYTAETPAPAYCDEIPDFILELCVPTSVLESKYDLELFKDELECSDWCQEWAWYRGIGKIRRRDLKMMIDHHLPAGLRYVDRVADPQNWQLAGEFFIAMMGLIRELGLVGSKPHRREGKLYFVKEVDLS